MAMLDAAITRGPGGNNNPEGLGGRSGKVREIDNRDNVTIDNSLPEPERGNTLSYAARRLMRDRPDLFERVKRGELSAHGAMLEAGFRRVPSALEIAKRAWKKLSATEREELRAWQDGND